MKKVCLHKNNCSTSVTVRTSLDDFLPCRDKRAQQERKPKITLEVKQFLLLSEGVTTVPRDKRSGHPQFQLALSQ